MCEVVLCALPIRWASWCSPALRFSCSEVLLLFAVGRRRLGGVLESRRASFFLHFHLAVVSRVWQEWLGRGRRRSPSASGRSSRVAASQCLLLLLLLLLLVFFAFLLAVVLERLLHGSV